MAEAVNVTDELSDADLLQANKKTVAKKFRSGENVAFTAVAVLIAAAEVKDNLAHANSAEIGCQ